MINKQKNGKTLSQQQKSVMENILSIQDFYNLKDHHRLISIIINKKQAERVFGQKKVMISDVFVSHQKIDETAKISIFAQKYTFENLVEKFKRPKSYRSNMLIEILSKKMETQIITSHQTRKQIWMLASGALFAMRTNKGLFEGLNSYDNYPNYYWKAIQLDLNRTIKHHQCNSNEIESLKQVLVAFSRRNPYIGYCQGLNFIAFFLLTMQFNPEESFWILSQITQTIIPMDYYTNMIGVACDQQIFLDILRLIKPKITNKFEEVGLDGSVLSIHWFVCLFTSALPFYLVKIVWDRLIVEGTTVFIKTGIIILSYFQKQILETTEFYEIIMLLEKGSKQLQIPQIQFNREFDKIYVNSKGLKIARDLYREFHLKEKLQQKVINSKNKVSEIKCSIEWPICVGLIEQNKRNRSEIQVWIYRQESSPKIIHDYLEKQGKSETTNSTINLNENKLKKTISDLSQQKTSEFVIGRMQHTCFDSKKKGIMTGKNLKKKKKDYKFLSMIMEADEENEDKTLSNLKKILRISTNFEIEDEDENEINQKPKSEIHQPISVNNNPYEKSETIQFFNNFVANNKQLAETIVSKK